MPYIAPREREDMDYMLRDAMHAGELNYAFCNLILGYVSYKGLSYQTINDVIGALEGAKAEFQRRVVTPYEDSKIKQNGDLPWPKVETKD